MATFEVQDGNLVLELTSVEKLAGLLSDVRVPLTAVAGVEVVAEPLHAVRGLRSPGLALPGRTKIGTWRRRDGRTVAVVRAGQPAVRVSVAGTTPTRRPLREILATVDEPDRVREQIADALSAHEVY